jgi:hypothetical protein
MLARNLARSPEARRLPCYGGHGSREFRLRFRRLPDPFVIPVAWLVEETPGTLVRRQALISTKRSGISENEEKLRCEE